MRKFVNISNFRELGGLKTSDGRTIKYGLFYRCGELHGISETERESLRELGIKVIFDLRSSEEKEKAPEPLFPGITQIAIPALIENEETLNQTLNFFDLLTKDMDPFEIINCNAFLKHSYQIMPFHNPAYQAIIDCIKQGETPILFHCSGGKDRTGIAANIIERILGIREDEIINNYLLSNQNIYETNKDYIDNQLRMKGICDQHLIQVIIETMSVKEEYITIMDIAINKRYGTFAQYIKEEYQMSENEKLKMQERFLRPDINAEVNKIREALIEDTRQLIQIPSKKELTTIKANAPYGQPLRDILDKVLEMGAKDGFKTKDFDGYVGRIEWGETGEIVGIVCHLDVVPEQSEGWIDPPYSGVVKNGIIYGRGSNDNKGPTMAIYHALKLVRSLGYKPKKRLHLIFGCDEESGMTCMDHYLAQTDEIPSFGFVPDCTFPLNYGEHGIATIKLTGNIPHFIESLQAGNHPQIVAQDARLNVTQIPEDFEKNFAFFLQQQQLSGKIQHHAGFDISLHGKAAHGSRVSQGKNAAIAMLSLIGAAWKDETCTQLAYLLESWQGNGFDIAYKNMKTGELTLSVGTLIKTGNNLECVLDLRYPADLSYSEIITKMQQKLANVLPGFQLTTLEHRAGFYLDPHTKLIKELEEIYRRVSKDEKSVCKVSNGDTYARKFKNFVAFGPTTNEHLKNPLIGQAHQPNEGMEISTLLQGCEIYAEAIIQLLECSRSTK